MSQSGGVELKIVSLLPSATEIVCSLGLVEDLVAVTHECDYPPGVIGKPQITSNLLNHDNRTSLEIHNHIEAALHRGSGIYNLDQALLQELSPDLILTQELCDVCAVSYQQVHEAVRITRTNTPIVSLEPNTLDEILGTILQVGHLTNSSKKAAEVVADLTARIQRVRSIVSHVSHRPRVLCMEWLDPVMVGGHWVPGMVEMAGGIDDLGKAGLPSFQVTWEQILAYQPEVIVLMPCGFHTQENVDEFNRTEFPPEWKQLPAVRSGMVFAVDGSSCFNRPGPRIVDGLEVLAQLLHGELMPTLYGEAVLRRVDP